MICPKINKTCFLKPMVSFIQPRGEEKGGHWGRNRTWGKRQRCLHLKEWTCYSKNTTKKLNGWKAEKPIF